MRGFSILLIVLCMAQARGAAVTPASEVRAALEDLSTRVAEPDRAATRYLSLYAVAPTRRAEVAAAVSFVLNSVSLADTIVLPELVPDTQGRLLRLSLRRFRIEASSWEAIAGEDVYWHLRAQVVDPRGGKVRTVVTDGGWVGLEQAARLRALSRSIGAVLRADYFLARAATTAEGGHYYRLARIPQREQDFFVLVGIEEAIIERLRADQGANVIRSNVTLKTRRVIRRQGPLGSAWHTLDVERSSPERDPIRNPLAVEYDASEHIVAKRNGLHLFALYDRRGRRQDSVPDRIAKDVSDSSGSGVIVPLLSCVRCHVEEGLRPIANDQRRLLAGAVELYAKREDDAERLASFYDRDLDKLLVRDRADYAEAVAVATGGLSVRRLAAALARGYADYVDALVSPAQAARELGVAMEDFSLWLRAANDPVILALVEGISVQRAQWEAAFAEAALLTTKGP